MHENERLTTHVAVAPAHSHARTHTHTYTYTREQLQSNARPWSLSLGVVAEHRATPARPRPPVRSATMGRQTTPARSAAAQRRGQEYRRHAQVWAVARDDQLCKLAAYKRDRCKPTSVSMFGVHAVLQALTHVLAR